MANGIVSRPLVVKHLGALRLGDIQLNGRDLPRREEEKICRVYERVLNSAPKDSVLRAQWEDLRKKGGDRPQFQINYFSNRGLVLEINGGQALVGRLGDELTKTYLKTMDGARNCVQQKGMVGRKVEDLSGAVGEREERIRQASERASESRKKAVEASIPKTLAQRVAKKIPQANSLTLDALGIIRNSIDAKAQAIQKSDPKGAAQLGKVFSGLAIASGILLVASGGLVVREGAKAGMTAVAHGDGEGKGLAGANIATGTILSTLGASVTAQNIAALTGAKIAEAGAVTALVGVGYAFYSLIALRGAYGIAISGSFRKTMNDKLGGEGEEKERLHETLAWMRSQVNLGLIEEMMIADGVLSPKEKGERIEKEVQRKRDQFARRTSEAACQKVCDQVTPELLQGLQEGKVEAIDQAKAIVGEVSKANFCALVKNVLLTIIGIMGIVAFILTGPASAILFVVGAILWYFLDWSWLNGKFTDGLWKIRNALSSESSFEVKERVCPTTRSTSPSPTSSTGSAPKKVYRHIRSMPTDETSRLLPSSP